MRDFLVGTFADFCVCATAAAFGKFFWRTEKKEDIFNL